MKKQYITPTVSGRKHRFSIGDGFGQVPPSGTLSQTLRKRPRLTGSKESCSEGACEYCTVLMDERGVTPCILLTVDCDEKDIITTEGLEDPEKGLDPLQQAFIDEYASQCGYYTPGVVMAAKAFLLEDPRPTGNEIKEAVSDNYCRYISHYTVLRATNKVVGNEKDHLAVMHRANNDVENPIPARRELFLSPYVNGTNSDHSLDQKEGLENEQA